MKNVKIIVPCYNEGKRLKVPEFVQFAGLYPNIHFIFVNDGSSDNTIHLIEKIQRETQGAAICINLQKNQGKGEAVRVGVLKAIEIGADIIGYWDADLSTPLKQIDRMSEKIHGDTDFVIGSRVKLLGHHINRLPLRHYMGRIFATFASIVLRLPVYDTQCGAKLFKNTDVIWEVFSKPFSVKWSFDVEFIGRLKILKNARNLKHIESTAVEYPLEEWRHINESKVKTTDLIVGIVDLIRLGTMFRHHRHFY
jgi:dolichyl-phosphate beta-glucosyltransferase